MRKNVVLLVVTKRLGIIMYPDQTPQHDDTLQNDKPKTFNGGPNADSIYSWVKRKSGDPAAQLRTLEDFNNFVNQGSYIFSLGQTRDLTQNIMFVFILVSGPGQ